MSSAVIGIGGALALGVGAASIGTGIYSANKAAGAEQSAAQGAQNTQMAMFNQTNANQAPFRAAGLAATNQESSYLGLPGAKPFNQSTLSNLPGYQFQLNQGTQAVMRSSAAAGLYNSGATAKALTQYGQGLAGSYGQQYLGGLQNMAALGEGATQSTAAAGAGAANQISSAQIYGGQAAASGDINTANAIGSGLSQGIGLYGMAQGLGQRNGGQAFTPQYGSSAPQTYGGAGGGYNPNASSSIFNNNYLLGTGQN